MFLHTYDRKKAQWYLKRDLAKLLENKNGGRAIQLLFDAKGNGHREGDYMIEDRKNICVGCGGDQQLTLHHVVPEMYRQWMPLVIKSKSSRDLLLLCKHCHDAYEQKAIQLKKDCVKRFGIPLEGEGWIYLPEHRRAKKAANALIRSSDKIPLHRQKELTETILNFWQKEKISESEKSDGNTKEEAWKNILQSCSELVDHYKGPDFVEHGKKAIQILTERTEYNDKNQEIWPDLEAFIKEWRQHFLDYLQPKYLSELWTIEGDIYTR
ncbi:hypothetical protein BDF20DRAFT_856852 [Mycotypha africana]|uniref:uncharacterized protein n=1 Tax=Mycotypha africana TaxID=64632 RepID=UPI002301BC52|nr:uncharacterized protein BDF20DRAFT_856852 [Mycotypha africana]KAI8988628.1 hypothetical protein BDF20DRAFT_856852 [Mycotypha africana]